MKQKNHFFMSYAGNKRNEFENIYEQIKDKLEGIDTIVEPFCGTSAFSYFLSLKHPKRFKYILNDNNRHLIESYKIFSDDARLDGLIDTLNSFSVDITKERYQEIKKQDETPNWLYKNKVYNIRPGLFPLGKIKTDFSDMKRTPIIDFLKTADITMTNEDAIAVIGRYKDAKNVLIFLDPPYLQACNDFYLEADTNIYEYLYNNSINAMGCQMLLVLEDNWIIKLLFKGNFTASYGKKYEGSQKNTSHLIIENR